MMFKGTYKFMTEATSKEISFAFLYSKLQEEDRDFVFTGGTTSWKRFNFSGQTENIHICIELPEPTGIYATEQDALNNIKKPGVAVRGSSGDGSADIPSQFLVTLFYEISVTPSNNFLNIFEVAGISTHPSGNPGINLEPIYYGFWSADGGVAAAIAPWEVPQSCPLFKGITRPTGLVRVGYLGELPTWKTANFIAPNSTNDLNYQNSGGVDNESWWLTDQNAAVTAASRKNIAAYENLISSSVGCSDGLNNDSWFGAELPHRYRSGGQTNNDFWICVSCDSRQKGAIESFLNQVKDYWEIPGTLRFLRGANAFGCNVNEDGTDYPEDPNPVPTTGVYSSRFKGRYSDLILNYQSRGKVKELKLPIEFPTRATKIKLIPTAPVEHYKPGLSIDSEGWQSVEQPLVSESFVGRVSMDKDNIYIAILYGTIREWEQGKLLPYEYNPGGFVWTPNRGSNPCVGDEFLNFGDDANARPAKDSWKFCRILVIDKQTFTITLNTLKTNPEPLTGSNQLFLDYNITHQETNPRYVLYNNVSVGERSDLLISNSELTNTSDCGFSGNPVCYPQITGTVRGNWTTSESGDRFFPLSTVPEFIKPQSIWNQKEWLFWNLLERPQKPLNNATTSYFRFGLENKFGGHGRSQTVPHRFYIDLPGIFPPFAGGRSYRTHENYFGEVVESERLRGSAIFDEQNIIKWIRISPYSYPYFEPGVKTADDLNNLWS